MKHAIRETIALLLFLPILLICLIPFVRNTKPIMGVRNWIGNQLWNDNT